MSNSSVARSSPNGTLSKYREKMTNQYLLSVENLKIEASNLAKNCQKQLSDFFTEFKKFEAEQKEKMDEIVSSMSTTQVPFEDLSQQISDIGDILIQESHNLQRKSLDLYDTTFAKLQPMIDKAFDDCKDIIPQIEPQYSDAMDFAVSQLNEQFLANKEKITELLDSFIVSAERIKQESSEEFLQRTDDWRANRFDTVFNNAKAKLDPLKQLEFGNLFDEFFQEQIKFTRCFKKSLQSFTIILPPDHFDEKDVEKWWQEVDEMLLSHANFINIYINKISDHLNEKSVENSNLIQSVEEELMSLKGEVDTQNALAELTPLHKHSQKINQVFIEKLTKYFDYKKANLRKVYETLHEFIVPIVQRYDKFIDDTKNSIQDVENRIKEESDKSEQTLSAFEMNLNEKEAEIQVLANEKDINQRIAQCKAILEKIEKEYRAYYDKIVAIYNGEPEAIKNIFDQSEMDLMNLLKVRKTAFAPEFENISRSGSSSKSRISMMRKQALKPKKFGKGKNQIDLFSFSTKNGAKFEELEPIKLIPVFEEFTDEPTTITNKKGSKGKSPPKKPPKIPSKPSSKSSKSKKPPEEEEIEIPEFNFISSIPVFDNHLAIEVYMSTNDDLENWPNDIRVEVFGSINDFISETIQKVQYTDERIDLAEQLNERMRVHAPRLNSLDINVAKARVLQIESRKMKLEKYFHHGAATFNKGLTTIEAAITKYKETILNDVEELTPYIQKIGEIKSIPHFVIIEQDFKYTEKTFLAKYEEAKKNVNENIENYIKSFQATNDRFIDSVINQENTYSEEEKSVAMVYFDKMQKQVADIVAALKEKVAQASIEIDNKYQSIADEFQSLVPRNTADVTFIDNLANEQHQSKTKFDTLLFRNKQQEQEIDILLNYLEESLNTDIDPQTNILNNFESLERLRVALLKRAKYLGILRSEISYEPIGFSLDLSTPVQGVEFDSSAQGPTDKKKGKTRNKSLPPKAKLALLQKKAPEQENLTTMQGQIDQIGNLLIQYATKTATDYFANLKSTKTTIIRTNDIPPNQNECIEKVRTMWNTQIEGVEKVFESSRLRLRSQMAMAITLSREATTHIYKNYYNYYLNQCNAQLEQNEKELKEKLENFKVQREINKTMLTPKMADQNNLESLNSLVKKELTREKDEVKLIQDYETTVIEGERNIMTMFTSHIPVITTSVMSLYDKFPLFEDLNEGPIRNPQRKTLRELLKTKERKASSLPDDQERPFKVKQWPTLPYIMEPLASIQPPVQPEQVSSSTKLPQASSSRKKSKKKEKEQQKTVEIETMPVITTIDTQLHRGVIVERNRAFDTYQECLKTRTDEFRSFINKLKEESKQFAAYWETSIHSLSPKYIFPKTV